MNPGISDSTASKILFFTATVDERGRIIIPASVRRMLKLSFGSRVFAGIEKVQNNGGAIIFSGKKEVKNMDKKSYFKHSYDEEDRKIAFENTNIYGSDLAPGAPENEKGEVRFKVNGYLVLNDLRVVFE